MAYCQTGADRVRQHQALADACRAREVVFTVNGEALQAVSVFKYLGRPLSNSDADWPAVYYNLKKTRKRWAGVSRVLT